MVNDPVGDFITRLTNASAVRKLSVTVPYSRLKHAVALKLVERGYLSSCEKHGKKIRKTLEVGLKYNDDKSPFIRGVKRISKPGRRLYAGVVDIHPVKFGRGTLVLSTPKGVKTGDEARKEKVGGEQMFIIW